MTLIKKRRIYFKKEAKQLLFSHWLSHIAAAAILMATGAGLAALGSCLTGVASLFVSQTAKNFAVQLLLGLIWVCLFLPVLYGYVRWNVFLYLGKALPLGALFDAYSSAKRFLATWRMLFAPVWRLVLILAVPYAAFRLLLSFDVIVGRIEQHYRLLVEPDAIYLVSVIGTVLLLIGAVVVACRYLPYWYLAAQQDDGDLDVGDWESPWRLIRTSVQLTKGALAEGALLLFSFSLWFILSLFTAGLLFLLFTVPFVSLTLIGYCSYLSWAGKKAADSAEHNAKTIQLPPFEGKSTS